MISLSTIRRFLAMGMLLVFTFGITPKRYWHDWLAGHTDMAVTAKADGQKHISKTGFQCDCDTLVATSPFTDKTEIVEIDHYPVCSPLSVAVSSSFYSTTYTYNGLRGPPQVG